MAIAIQPNQSANLRPHGQNEMRIHNCKLILDIIVSQQSISRIQLAKMTGMSATSITRITNELIGLKLISELGSASNELGRKATNLGVAPDAFYSLGISIDEKQLNLAVIDFSDEVIYFKKISSKEKFINIDEVLHVTDKFVDSFQQEYSERNISSIGVSVAGQVNKQGLLVKSPQLNWNSIDIKRAFTEYFQCPVVVDNDAKSGIVSLEKTQLDLKCDNLIYFTVGSGVGSAVVVDGELLRGSHNMAGEIGHTTLVYGGEECACGNKGCFNAYLSDAYLFKVSHEKPDDQYNVAVIINDYQRYMTYNEYVFTTKRVAIALNALQKTYDPQVIICSGEFFDKNRAFYQESIATFKRDYLYPDDMVISLNELGSKDTVLGAAINAKSEHLKQLISQS